MGVVLSLIDMGGGFPGLDGSEVVTDDENGGETDREISVTLKKINKIESESSSVISPTREFDTGSEIETNSKRQTIFRKLKFPDLTLETVSAVVTPVLDALFPASNGEVDLSMHVDIIAEPGRY